MESELLQNISLSILANICGYFSDKATIVTNFNALGKGIIKEDDFLFFLKGGMAYEILHQNKFPLDIDPRAGNDFDTILLINPALEPAVFDALKSKLKKDIFTRCIFIVGNPSFQIQMIEYLDGNKIPVNSSSASSSSASSSSATPPREYYFNEHPFSIINQEHFWDIDLMSIFLNTSLYPMNPDIKTKMVDISIPYRHYNLLPFDYALYSIPGRVISKLVNIHTIFIADFLSILFDQSVTNKLNTAASANKRERRTARIRNLNTKTAKANRNAIINTITPYLKNEVLNGFVTNGVITGYKKEIPKALPILPSPSSSSSSSSSSSASPITVEEAAESLHSSSSSASAPDIKGPPGMKKEPLNEFQARMLQKKAAANAAKAASNAAKGTT